MLRPPSRTWITFLLTRSSHRNPIRSNRGISSESIFRRTLWMVRPHRAKFRPWKERMAQQKKDRPVHRVLPLRTAPSQRMACRSRSGEPGRHQVSTRLCFSEKTI